MVFRAIFNIIAIYAAHIILKIIFPPEKPCVILENYYALFDNVSVSLDKASDKYTNDILLHKESITLDQKPYYGNCFISIPPLSASNQRLVDSANHLKFSYAIFKNVIVNAFSTFGFNGIFFYKHQHTPSFSKKRFIKTSGKLRHECNDFVLCGSQLSRINWGHMHCDTLLPMLMIPDEVRAKAYVFCPVNKSNFVEGLELIGFKSHRIIHTDESEWIYAKRYHTIVEPLPFLIYFGECCRKYHDILMDKLNLTSVPNDQYFFCNREKGYWRHLTNMDEIFNQTQLQYPSINWQYLKDFFPNLREAANNWVRIKFIFLPTGSNAYKCLAMKPGSVLVVASSMFFDHSIMRLMISTDLFNIWFFVNGMEHFGDKNKPNIVNVTQAMNAISIGVYAALNQKLPN